MVMFVFSSAGLSAAIAGPFAASNVRLRAEIVKKCFIGLMPPSPFDVILVFLKSEWLVLENILQHVAWNADVEAGPFFLNQHGRSGIPFFPSLVQGFRHLAA